MGEVAHGAMGRKQEVRDMKRLRRWLGIALAVPVETMAMAC